MEFPAVLGVSLKFNWVKIRSKSGPNQVQREGFGGGRFQRGSLGPVGPAGKALCMAPRKVLTKRFESLLRPFFTSCFSP